MMIARFVDGKAANLEAAAMDALEWLKWTQSMVNLRGNNRERLSGAIASLEKYLPADKPIFETAVSEEAGNDD